MEFLLFLAIIMLLINSGDRNAQQTGEQMAAGVATAFGLMVVGFILVVGFALAPTFTKWALIALAAGAVALLVRWIYKRFFSAQAKINRGYKRMNKRYYALSWSVRVNLAQCKPEDLSWQVEESERILKRCREEHERYSKLPPETDSPYLADFYPKDIQALEDLIRKAKTPE